MDIKILTQKEEIAHRLLHHLCFAAPVDKDYKKWLDDPAKYSKDPETRLGAFDDSGNLLAALQMIPYSMYFDGNPVKMCGIGSVVSAPEARGSGIVNELMSRALSTMRDENYMFSLLHPFSYDYYRKFGYELGFTPNKAEIPIESFCKYPFPKNCVRFWDKSQGLSDIKYVYDIFKKGRNYAIDRDDKSWEEMMKDDPYITKKYTYIHYDSQGVPDSYLIFRAGERPSRTRTEVNVNELAWSTKAGLLSMFGFIGGLRPQYYKVIWVAPADLDFASLFPEALTISVKLSPSIMTRIINLPAALRGLRAPALFNGKVVLDIEDKSLPCNTGRYAISWENGKISVDETGHPPDMATTIEAMAQLVSGYQSPDMAVYRKDTAIYSRHEALLAIFPRKSLFLGDKF